MCASQWPTRGETKLSNAQCALGARYPKVVLDGHERTHLHRAVASAGQSLGNGQRLVEITHVYEEITTKLLARLCERPIRDDRPSVPHLHTSRRGSRVKRAG